mgnify:CR=1 FL=1|jgi:hypothetical protein
MFKAQTNAIMNAMVAWFINNTQNYELQYM